MKIKRAPIVVNPKSSFNTKPKLTAQGIVDEYNRLKKNPKARPLYTAKELCAYYNTHSLVPSL